MAVDDAATVAEDDPATAIDVLANDTDVDGGRSRRLGDAAGQRDGGDHRWRGRADLPAGPELLQRPARHHARHVRLHARAGRVDGDGVGDGDLCRRSPVAVDDAATVVEDDAATAIDVLANDTDRRRRPDRRRPVTQPANGTVVITGGGDGLTYQPNPNYCNIQPGTTPDTFTYTLTRADRRPPSRSR